MGRVLFSPKYRLTSIKKTHLGNNTVYFLEFLNSRMLVLKGGNEIPTLFFGSIFAKVKRKFIYPLVFTCELP